MDELNVQIFVTGLAALLVALPFVLNRYLQRLPSAPICPACQAVTRERPSGGWVAHAWPALAMTVVRECVRCGWAGRMRWRWATRSVRGEPN